MDVETSEPLGTSRSEWDMKVIMRFDIIPPHESVLSRSLHYLEAVRGSYPCLHSIRRLRDMLILQVTEM